MQPPKDAAAELRHSNKIMSAFYSALFFIMVGSSTSSDLKNISARPGQNVSLTCEALLNDTTTALEWSRSDIHGKYVYLYRSYNAHQDDQHEFYRNRVFLRDPQMKKGDLSVILKNVALNDSGIYESKIRQENDPPGVLKSICVIHLLVSPAGNKDGGRNVEKNYIGVSLNHPGLITLFVFFLLAVVVLLAVVLWIYKKKKHVQSCSSSNNDQKPEMGLLDTNANTERSTANAAEV